jgi:hypothetical protein
MSSLNTMEVTVSQFNLYTNIHAASTFKLLTRSYPAPPLDLRNRLRI